MDKKIEKAPILRDFEYNGRWITHDKYSQNLADHDYYMKAFEGYKSPEEVYQFVVDATNKGNAIGAKQARQDAFKEVGNITEMIAKAWLVGYSARILDDGRDKDYGLSAKSLAGLIVERLKSGQNPGEKKE